MVHEQEGTRAQLLAAARNLYLEEGPAHFSLREVARRVGVSAAAVYRHFDGKEALVGAACTQGFLVFSSYLVRALEVSTPLGRLLATGDQYRLFALENPLDYRFIFMNAPDSEATPKKVCPDPPTDGRPQDSAFRFLVDRVQECIDARVLGRGEARELAVLIWAHVHGLVSLRLSGHLGTWETDEAFGAFYQKSVSRLLTGLGR